MQELGFRKRRKQRGKQRRRMSVLRRLLMFAAALLFIAAVWLFVDYQRQAKQVQATQEALRAEVERASLRATVEAQAEPTEAITMAAESPPEVSAPGPTPVPLPTPGAAMLPHLVSVYRQNSDLVGWLKSDSVEAINYPVVQRDNWHYVDHDFYGRQNVAGTVFLDEANRIIPQSQNLILHGHNMKNGSMFGKLSRYMKREELVKDPFMTFTTLYLSQVYVPYAITLTSIDPASGRYFNFLQPDFDSYENLEEYAGWLRARSELHLPVDVLEGDQLLTLVTCHGNEASERLVVALRALRPTEEQAWMAETISREAFTRR